MHGAHYITNIPISTVINNNTSPAINNNILNLKNTINNNADMNYIRMCIPKRRKSSSKWKKSELGIIITRTLFNLKSNPDEYWIIKDDCHLYDKNEYFTREIFHVRKIKLPYNNESLNIDIKKINNHTFGYYCPFETPESKEVGLIKFLSVTAIISPYTYIDLKLLENKLINEPIKKFITYNSKFVGFLLDKEKDFINELYQEDLLRTMILKSYKDVKNFNFMEFYKQFIMDGKLLDDMDLVDINENHDNYLELDPNMI
ncbi:hypothetical protein U3516DRAFT_736774 [Neocallimastix sp. 'constans']